LQGIHKMPFPNIRTARVTLNLSSQAGREDWIPTKLISTDEGWLAEPIFGKSNMILALARADGLICIPEDHTGISANEIVTVELLE
ncbi:MAG: molybdopterin molybdenumtransferase MoeA, partial [Anaerolineales bacterium]